MKTLFILSLLVLLSLSWANDVTIVRNYIWRNFNDFINYGWTEEFQGTTKTYAAPSELHPKLYELNKNFTEEVWGFKPQDAGRSQTRYTVDLRTKPEFCGLINATLSLRYYMEEGLDGFGRATYMFPSCTGHGRWPYECYLPKSSFATWASITQPLAVTPYTNNVHINIRLAQTGLFLLDEVRLTYAVQQGINCPYSCNQDCDYRAIDCHNYYTCIDRRYKEFRTCNSSNGLAFNPDTKSCDLIENVRSCNRPRGPAPLHCVCEFRPHRRDCSRYFYCPDTCRLEECEERQCPSGLLWSLDAKGDGSGQQQCAPPSKATCYNGTGILPPEGQSTTTVEPTTTLLA